MLLFHHLAEFVSLFSLCIILGAGLFSGAVLRPAIMSSLKRNPALAQTHLTLLFSRYNRVALASAVVFLLAEAVSTRNLLRLAIGGVIASILTVKLFIDERIKARESSGQLRGDGDDGKALDTLHRLMERATLMILALASTLVWLS